MVWLDLFWVVLQNEVGRFGMIQMLSLIAKLMDLNLGVDVVGWTMAMKTGALC